MKRLKQLISKTALAGITAGMLFASHANADNGGSSNSCPQGTFKCVLTPTSSSYHCCDICADCIDINEDGVADCNCSLSCILCKLVS